MSSSESDEDIRKATEVLLKDIKKEFKKVYQEGYKNGKEKIKDELLKVEKRNYELEEENKKLRKSK